MQTLMQLLVVFSSVLTILFILIMIGDIKYALNVFIAILKASIGVAFIMLIVISVYQFWKWVLL